MYTFSTNITNEIHLYLHYVSHVLCRTTVIVITLSQWYPAEFLGIEKYYPQRQLVQTCLEYQSYSPHVPIS